MACVRLWIHFFYAWRKSNLGTTFFQKLAVAIKSAWVALQVFRIVKLSRIKEDAHHGYIILFHRTANERCVTFVKSTHCWHKTNLLFIFSQGSNCLLEFLYRIDYFHLLFLLKTIVLV